MSQKRVLLLVIVGFLLFGLAFEVSAQNLLDDVFSIFEGVNMADIYNSYSKVIDFFIYLALFIGVAQAALFKRFEGRAGKAISVAVGVSLALSLVMFTDFSIASFGPVAAAIFVILVAMVLFNLIKSVVKNKAGSAAMAFLITYYLLKAVIPNLFDWIEKTPGLGLIRALLGIATIISLYTIFRFIWSKLAPTTGKTLETISSREEPESIEEPITPPTINEGVVKITVEDSEGNKISGVAIHTRRRGGWWNPNNWSGWKFRNYTDKNGELEFKAKQGHINIQSSKQGYHPKEASANVVAQSTINVPIILTLVTTETGDTSNDLEVKIVSPGEGQSFSEGEVISFEAHVTGGSKPYSEHKKPYMVYSRASPNDKVIPEAHPNIPEDGIIKKSFRFSYDEGQPERKEPFMIGILIHDKETGERPQAKVKFFITKKKEESVMKPQIIRLHYGTNQVDSTKDRQIYEYPNQARLRVMCYVNDRKGHNYDLQLLLRNKSGDKIIKEASNQRQNVPFEADIDLYKFSKTEQYDLVFRAAYHKTTDFLEDTIQLLIKVPEESIKEEVAEDIKKKKVFVPAVDKYHFGGDADSTIWWGITHKKRAKEFKSVIIALTSLKTDFKTDIEKYHNLQRELNELIRFIEQIRVLYHNKDKVQLEKYPIGELNTQIDKVLNMLTDTNWRVWLDYYRHEELRTNIILGTITLPPNIKSQVEKLLAYFKSYISALTSGNLDRAREIDKSIDKVWKYQTNLINYLKRLAREGSPEFTAYREGLMTQNIGDFPELIKTIR